MKERAAQGIGIETKQAQEITVEEENLMLQKGILGMDTSQKVTGHTCLFDWAQFRITGRERSYEPMEKLSALSCKFKRR